MRLATRHEIELVLIEIAIGIGANIGGRTNYFEIDALAPGLLEGERCDGIIEPGVVERYGKALSHRALVLRTSV